MKTPFWKRWHSRLLAPITMALLVVAVNGFSQVNFTVSPSAVSNTYQGPVVLQVTGLSSGDTAVVQKFLDLNGNGVIDAGDLLVQQFTLTDGQAGMVIGGVTNINVPGDSDATAGQITARMPFPDGDFAQTFAGQYLFKLSSPAGAATNVFTVTNLPYAQAFAGSVVNNGTNVPNAVVVLFPPPQGGNHGPGTPVAATVADSSGNYTLRVPAGTYMPIAFGRNFVSDSSMSPLLALTNGTTITTNLALVNATTSISGQLVDAANPSLALPGFFLPVSSKTGLISICSSDTNGNFTAAVTAGTWKFDGEPSGLTVHGYVGYQGGTNVSAGASGVIGAFSMANALFYGRVTDGSGNPLTGIDIYANDSYGQYQADGYSYTNGKYAVGVLGGISGDTWNLQVSSGGNSGNPTNYIFSQPLFDQNGGTNLSANQAVQVDFTALMATNFLTGNVQHDGTNVAGVGVSANATINGINYNVFADTDANGNYSFNVTNGDWSVGVNCNGGNDSLDNILGPGNYQCPNNQNITISNNNGVVNFNVQDCGGIQVLTTNLPDGQVGLAYTNQLEAASCNGNFTWSVYSGTVPPGLTLYSSGVFSGKPTTTGIYNFTFHVSDGGGASTNQTYTVTIQPAPAPPTIVSPALVSRGHFQMTVNGSAGQNYTVQMSTNLASTNWMSILITNPPVGSFQVADPNATNNARFYRILLGP